MIECGIQGSQGGWESFDCFEIVGITHQNLERIRELRQLGKAVEFASEPFDLGEFGEWGAS